MANITYDLDSLIEAKKSINELKDTLNKTNKNLNTSMEALKEAWKTEAGKNFFDNHKDTWAVYVTNYSKKLEGIEQMLNSVISEYESINDEISKLKF